MDIFGRPGSSHVQFGQVSPFPTTEMWLLVQTSDDSTSLQVGLLRGLLQCMVRVPFHLPMKVTPGLTLIRHWDGRLSSKASAGLLLCGTAGAASQCNALAKGRASLSEGRSSKSSRIGLLFLSNLVRFLLLLKGPYQDILSSDTPLPIYSSSFKMVSIG